MRFSNLLAAGALLLATHFARADGTLLGNLNDSDANQGMVTSSTMRAVTFTTSGSAFTISSVTFRLSNYISATDEAIVTLNLGTTDEPGAVVGSFLAPESTLNDPDNFVFTAEGDITLTANTLYWLVIAAGNNTDTFSWVRADPAETPTGVFTFGEQMIRDSEGAWSEGESGPHTFAVNGAVVPEPAAVFFTGIGFTIALLAARRRRV